MGCPLLPVPNNKTPHILANMRGKSGREDLNLRPPAPEAGALTGLRYAP